MEKPSDLVPGPRESYAAESAIRKAGRIGGAE